MTRAAWLAGIGLGIASVAAAAPTHAAPPGIPVVIVAHTEFTTEASAFDSTLEGCATGEVVNGIGGAHFTPWGGSFNGTKVFTCDGDEAGFTIRLNARFGGNGSRGTWTLVEAWGDLAGLKGSGSLVGIPTGETSIDDVYTGAVR